MRWNQIISTLTTTAFFLNVVLAPSVAMADPPTAPTVPGQITTLKLGEPAPFDGTLFSTKAAAKLLIDLEYNSTTCGIEKNRELGILRSQLQLQIDLCQARRDALKLQMDDRLKIKTSQIDFLQEQIKGPSWYEHPVFWFAVGFVVAGAATIGITYAVNQGE